MHGEYRIPLQNDIGVGGRTRTDSRHDRRANDGPRAWTRHLIAGRGGRTMEAMPGARDNEAAAGREDVRQFDYRLTQEMFARLSVSNERSATAPVRFRQMVVDHGGAEAARRLLSSSKPQVELETLHWHGRLRESNDSPISGSTWRDTSPTGDSRSVAAT
jgi:hypothetical protein